MRPDVRASALRRLVHDAMIDAGFRGPTQCGNGLVSYWPPRPATEVAHIQYPFNIAADADLALMAQGLIDGALAKAIEAAWKAA